MFSTKERLLQSWATNGHIWASPLGWIQFKERVSRVRRCRFFSFQVLTYFPHPNHRKTKTEALIKHQARYRLEDQFSDFQASRAYPLVPRDGKSSPISVNPIVRFWGINDAALFCSFSLQRLDLGFSKNRTICHLAASKHWSRTQCFHLQTHRHAQAALTFNVVRSSKCHSEML